MLPYYVILIYLLFIMFFDFVSIENIINNENYQTKITRCFNYRTGFLVLFLFAALRGNGNGDYQNYINGIPQIKTLTQVLKRENYPFEIGLRAISFVTNSLSLHPQFALAIMNLISMSAVYYFVNKYSEFKGTSLFLFYSIVLIFDMHHSRSAVAMSLGLVFFDKLYEGEYIKSFLFFLLAISFHKSGVILLLLTPIVLIEGIAQFQEKFVTRPELKLMILVCIVILLLVFPPINVSISLLNNPVTQSLHNKLSSYLKRDRWSYPFSVIDPRFLLIIYVYIVYIYTNDYSILVDNKLVLIQLLSILSIASLRISTIMVVRVYNFFNLFSIVLIPNAISNFSNHGKLNINLQKKSKINMINKKTRQLGECAFLLMILMYIIYTFALISIQVDYFTVFKNI